MKKKRQLYLVSVIICLSAGMSCFSYKYYCLRRSDMIVRQTIDGDHWQRKVKWYQMHRGNSSSKIFLGNSLTEGFDLVLLDDPTVLNRGISGDFTYGVLQRLREILDSKPKKIFIEIGINDIVEKVPDRIILKNYSDIISSIKKESPVTEVYIQSIFPVALKGSFFTSTESLNRKVDDINNNLRLIARDSGIVFIDIHHRLVYNHVLKAEFSIDGIHLTEAGYKEWCQTVLPFVKEQ